MSVWILCASVKPGALIETEKIAYEYWNNRNWLMRKSKPFFQKSTMSLFSSLTNFYCFNIHVLITLWIVGFAGRLKCIGKSVSAWIFCAGVNFRVLKETEKIAHEYWNNRNWLMSKSEQFFPAKFGHVPFQLINQFLLFQYSCVDGCESCNCQRGSPYRNGEIASEVWNNRNRLMGSSLTNFCCFNIHALITSRKRWFARRLSVRWKECECVSIFSVRK